MSRSIERNHFYKFANRSAEFKNNGVEYKSISLHHTRMYTLHTSTYTHAHLREISVPIPFENRTNLQDQNVSSIFRT
jgi:hypothetical protein